MTLEPASQAMANSAMKEKKKSDSFTKIARPSTTKLASKVLDPTAAQYEDEFPAVDSVPSSTVDFMTAPTSGDAHGSPGHGASTEACPATPLPTQYAHSYQTPIPIAGYAYSEWSPEPAAYAYALVPHPVDVSAQANTDPGRGMSFNYGILPVGHMTPFLGGSPTHTMVPILASSWKGKPRTGVARRNTLGKSHLSNTALSSTETNSQLPNSPTATASAPTLHGQAFHRNANSASVMALAQVAEQAVLQSSLKYGNSSMSSSPVLPSSPTRLYHDLEPDVLSKASQGPPIPPPVPSLFVAPTFEDALESSLYNPNNTTNVYIRGLPPDTTDESLVEICKRFGEIASSKAIIDAQTNTCKGFGFACFVHEADATSCIAGLIHYGYQVSFAKESFSTRLKNLQDPESTNLYLSNMPLDMHEKDLEELFRPHKVVSNRILRTSNNISRGVGFARMADRESAEAIIKKFENATDDEGSRSCLQVRFADSHSQKRLKSQTQRRRQWRAREYNILTGNISAEDGFLFDTYPALDPFQAISQQGYSDFGYAGYRTDSLTMDNQMGYNMSDDVAAQPRSLQPSSAEATMRSGNAENDDDASSLAGQIAAKLGVEEGA